MSDSESMTECVLEEAFTDFDTYEKYALDHVGIIDHVKVATKRGKTVVKGTIFHDDEKRKFQRCVFKKWEYGFNGLVQVKETRRLLKGQPVTFNIDGTGAVTKAIIWCPSEMEKIERQSLRNEPFTHRLVCTIHFREPTGIQSNPFTQRTESTVLWEGRDLPSLRYECPKNQPKWAVVNQKDFRRVKREEAIAHGLGDVHDSPVQGNGLAPTELNWAFPYMPIDKIPDEPGNVILARRSDDTLVLVRIDTEEDTYQEIAPSGPTLSKKKPLEALRQECVYSWYTEVNQEARQTRIKTSQLFQYYDPFSSEWVDCLDPR